MSNVVFDTLAKYVNRLDVDRVIRRRSHDVLLVYLPKPTRSFHTIWSSMIGAESTTTIASSMMTGRPLPMRSCDWISLLLRPSGLRCATRCRVENLVHYSRPSCSRTSLIPSPPTYTKRRRRRRSRKDNAVHLVVMLNQSQSLAIILVASANSHIPPIIMITSRHLLVHTKIFCR